MGDRLGSLIMKVIREYEPSDIHIDDLPPGETMDPVISFLMAEYLVTGLTGFKPRPEDGTTDEQRSLMMVKRWIAQFLNHAEKVGISIAVGEKVPEVYRS